MALDLWVVGELSQGLEHRRASPASFLLGCGAEKGEMPSSPPLFLTINGKWESWFQGHESRRTCHVPHQRVGPESCLGSMVEMSLVVGLLVSQP